MNHTYNDRNKVEIETQGRIVPIECTHSPKVREIVEYFVVLGRIINPLLKSAGYKSALATV